MLRQDVLQGKLERQMPNSLSILPNMIPYSNQSLVTFFIDMTILKWLKVGVWQMVRNVGDFVWFREYVIGKSGSESESICEE